MLYINKYAKIIKNISNIIYINMKKQKIKKHFKKFFKKHFYFASTLFFITGTVFWAFTSTLITPQTSTEVWSNNNEISFTWSSWNQGYYVNEWDDSAIIGNYFEGYYYDSLYWFFRLDWSSNKSENVRIIWSTTACATWYWYKLGWKAYSENAWYIDFNYNSSTFVYFCASDGKLHGTAYSEYIWFQDFEWIIVWVVSGSVPTNLTEKVENDTVFVNDTSNIDESTTSSPAWTEWWTVIETFGWDFIQFDPKKESVFYIIK